MVSFCFSCGTPCKTQKGLENYAKSRPKCLHDLGIARAESLGLSLSSPSTQLINHHSFRFETNPNLASKRSVEVMWQDENSLEAASFMPEDSPSKSRKGSSASSILRSAGNSSLSYLSIVVEQRKLTWCLMTMRRVVHCRTFLSINFLQRSLLLPP
jgi:hypothetical protein